ncbi:MAG: T9SS type A sorting domain-containing protein [Bacteroidia bacterium]|nr:T9SS type A sorting domain-containing protein [Bacteroidia bacterium]
MKKLLTSAASLFFIFHLQAQTLTWSKFTDSTVTFSSPRASDLNGDGVKDIIIGAGKDGQQTNYGILALDGVNGNNLWTLPAPNEVFTSPAFMDITGDNIDDVFLGGRDAQLYAINGATGAIIWEFFPPALNPIDSGLYNFYSVQFVPDQNSDGVSDLLVANGGDHAAPVWQTNRPPGHLMVVDAMNGDVLAKAVVPDSAEIYCSPVVSELRGNGTLYVIFGTGGETLGGSMWVAELQNDLMNNDLSNAVAIRTNATKGFVAPPSIGNFSNDGNLDIIVQGYDGSISRYYGGNFSLKWSTTIPGCESSAAPCLGNFTGSITPDVFCVLYKGVAPSYSDYYQVMLNGANGSLTFKDSISFMHFTSANAFDSNGDGRDEVLISVNNHVGHFQHQLKLIDFQNNTVNNFWASEAGSNLGSTPYIGDLDNDNKLDIVFSFRADSMNPMGWKGLRVKRLSTNINMPIAGIAWGSYMGTKHDGHYTYNVTPCAPGSIFSGVSANNPSCNGFADGSVIPFTANGTAPITFLWSNGSVGSTLTGVAAGTYSCTVTDSTGCTETNSVTLVDPFVIGFGGVVHNTCPGGNNGQATVTSSGCVCMFSGCTFLWSTGATAYTATALAAGTYSVTITHLGGCVVNTSIIINDGLPVIDSASAQNISCFGFNDGNIELFATNAGTAVYNWNNGPTTAINSTLDTGNYFVYVSDARPCYDTLNFSITEPTALLLSMNSTPESSFGMNDGGATAIVSGGTPAYAYQWNDVANQTTNPATGLSTGMYQVIVTDANGCVTTDSVLVNTTNFIGENNSEISFFVYPNPAKELINLNLNGNFSEGCDVKFYDESGKLLEYFGQIRNNYLKIERGNLPGGIYFIEVNSGKAKKSLRVVLQ